jgi:hypothetical protein
MQQTYLSLTLVRCDNRRKGKIRANIDLLDNSNVFQNANFNIKTEIMIASQAPYCNAL